MPDYSLGKIYKIVDNTNGKIYVGSTCEPTLSRRLAKHVNNYKCYLNEKSNYMSSFKILVNQNYDIILIENYPCESKDELHARERHYIESIECVNKFIPTRTKSEYTNDHKNEKKEYDKAYRENNKEKIKEYRENNKEKLKEKKKEYYENNKEKYKITFSCICGSKMQKHEKTRHEKTKKHQAFINSQTTDI